MISKLCSTSIAEIMDVDYADGGAVFTVSAGNITEESE
jgi:hypothetical protein